MSEYCKCAGGFVTVLRHDDLAQTFRTFRSIARYVTHHSLFSLTRRVLAPHYISLAAVHANVYLHLNVSVGKDGHPFLKIDQHTIPL